MKLIRPNPVRRLAGYLAEAARRKDIISFGGGAPSLPPPIEVVEAMQNALKEDPQRAVSYGATPGFIELRELIAADLKKYGGQDPDPRTQITVTDGGTQALLLTFLALFNPGDKVAIFDPSYLAYPDLLRIVGAVPVPVPVDVENGYQPEIDRVEKAVEGARGIVILSPDNPTGRVLKEDLAQAIVDIAVERDLWIVSDDIYNHMIYEGEHTLIPKIPGAEGRTVTTCSYSKTASVPGLRIGYIYGPKEAVDAVVKIEQYTTLCPNSLSQLAMMAFHQGDVKERYLRDTVVPTYRERRDVMGKAISKYLPEAKTAKPSGAFYYFVDMRSYLDPIGMQDEPFIDEMLNTRDVVCIPGSYFGDNGRNHFRMTFVSEPPARIEEGMKRMAAFVDDKSQAKTAKAKAISRS